MNSEGRPGSVRFVLVLAAVFLLQSLLGAVSQSMAGPLDQFGNPLCVTGLDHAGSQNDHGTKHQSGNIRSDRGRLCQLRKAKHFIK